RQPSARVEQGFAVAGIRSSAQTLARRGARPDSGLDFPSRDGYGRREGSVFGAPTNQQREEGEMRSLTRIVFFAALGWPAMAPPAAASVTIGQTGTPTAPCAAGADRLQPTVTGGTSFVVPSTIAEGRIVSWSTEAQAGAGQQLALKVYRLASGNTYTV